MEDEYPKFKFNIKPTLDTEAHTLMLEMNRTYGEMVTKLSTEIYRFKDAAVIEALIKLGWTPPE